MRYLAIALLVMPGCYFWYPTYGPPTNRRQAVYVYRDTRGSNNGLYAINQPVIDALCEGARRNRNVPVTYQGALLPSVRELIKAAKSKKSSSQEKAKMCEEDKIRLEKQRAKMREAAKIRWEMRRAKTLYEQFVRPPRNDYYKDLLEQDQPDDLQDVF